ncbi:MAG: HEPN domain-containing protein [Gammaproteobacteria bacterium]
MSDQIDLARGWLLKAHSDLLAARRILAGDGSYDTACFHTQQAMEKTFKGLLAHLGQPIPRTHDLEELAVLCRQIESLPELPLDDLADATDYAVLVRYDIEIWPSQEEAREALVLAEQVSALIRSHLPREVHP